MNPRLLGYMRVINLLSVPPRPCEVARPTVSITFLLSLSDLNISHRDSGIFTLRKRYVTT